MRSSDAVIGFTARREAVEGGYSTHRWVVDELTAAHGNNIPFIEVREDGVVPQGGIIDGFNAQRIHFAAERMAECLVQLAGGIGHLKTMTELTTIRIGPDVVVNELAALVNDPTFRCQTRVLKANAESEWMETRAYPIQQGLFVRLRGLAQREPVQIMISARGRVWSSDFEMVDTVDVKLREML